MKMQDMIDGLVMISPFMTDINTPFCFHGEHDILYVGADIDKEAMSETTLTILSQLGFHWNDEYDRFEVYT